MGLTDQNCPHCTSSASRHRHLLAHAHAPQSPFVPVCPCLGHPECYSLTPVMLAKGFSQIRQSLNESATCWIHGIFLLRERLREDLVWGERQWVPRGQSVASDILISDCGGDGEEDWYPDTSPCVPPSRPFPQGTRCLNQWESLTRQKGF